jgi:hypothetical protein
LCWRIKRKGARTGAGVDKCQRREELRSGHAHSWRGQNLQHGDGLEVKVAKHEIALSAAKEADQIAVNSGCDQKHGSGDQEGFHGDINRVVTN